MTTLVADPTPLPLRGDASDVHLDDSRLAPENGALSLSLNGRTRSSVVPPRESRTPDVGWLEPPPNVEAMARTISRLRIWTGHNDLVSIVAPIEIYSLEQGQLVRAVHYTLTIAIGTTRDEHIIRWWLEPGGSDASLRADGLAFLEALHQPGELELVDETGSRVASIRLEGAPFDGDLRDARRFLADVAALEEWTGRKIPVPAQAEPGDVTDVVRAAAIVRARVVPLILPNEMELTARSTDADLAAIDSVVLPRELYADLLGVELPLGTFEILAGVEAVSVAERTADDSITVACRLAPDQPRATYGHLWPPPSRSRLIRRTLVGNAPLPPDGLLSEQAAAELRQCALTSFLATELSGRQLPAELLRTIEAKWSE